jgi:hypothetical protein
MQRAQIGSTLLLGRGGTNPAPKRLGFKPVLLEGNAHETHCEKGPDYSEARDRDDCKAFGSSGSGHQEGAAILGESCRWPS